MYKFHAFWPQIDPPPTIDRLGLCCGSQLLVDGTPNVAIVVGTVIVADGEVVWTAELQILA